MGDILIHLASRMLQLLGRWSCGDRASDLHQIPRLAYPSQRTRTEPTPLRMDVAQFDVGKTHQPVRLAVLQRRVRALRQTCSALRDIPAEPLVAGLAADSVLTAQHHLILAR